MKLRLLICALVSIGIASSTLAGPRLVDAAYTVITVKDPENISSAVMEAYHTVFIASELLERDMYNSIADAYRRDDIQYQDQVFQLQKRTLNKLLTESDFYLTLFADTTIQIANDGYGNSYSFFFPKGGMTALGLLPTDNIDTVENANISLSHINTIIYNLNSLLPSDLTSSSLKAFASKSTSVKPNISGGEMIIKGTDSVDAILNSLVREKAFYMNNLNEMKRYAEAVIAGQKGNREGFASCLASLDSFIGGSSIWGIRVFNGGSFKVRIGDQTKTYDMPKLSITTFNLDNDVLTNDTTIQNASTHVLKALHWIRYWAITGHAPTEDMQNISDQALLKPIFGKLSTERKMAAIKIIKGETMSH